jgi:imidazolonepropionase-like amidohydrolase
MVLAAPTRLLFKNGRVFDGAKVQVADVLVEGGTIRKVGPGLSAAGAKVIDAQGKTLLPGLIDAHTHAYLDDALIQALVFGVTTELDMFGDPTKNRALRAQEKAGEATGQADLRSAGTLATAPGGHGTEYGFDIPTLTTPEEAKAFVAARLGEGSDYLKIVVEDGKPFSKSGIPTLTLPTVTALVQAAHEQHLLALVHISTQRDARAVIDAGADGLAHIFCDGPPAADFGAFVARHRAFVIPTLAVTDGMCEGSDGSQLAGDPALAPYLRDADVRQLKSAFPTKLPRALCDGALAAVKQLAEAHVDLLAGTDALNPAVAHGLSLHRELELLVRAGLTPVQALIAATAAPATRFGLADRGRIAPGLRADLLLVDGDPTTDIRCTRAIVSVWKRGVPVDREAWKRKVEAERKQIASERATPPPPGSESGEVADFDEGKLAARFGAWSPSTDQLRGGTSTVDLRVVDGGAERSKRALEIAGEIRGSGPATWAGAMLSPGPGIMAPANLSAKKTLEFWVKGDGHTHRVMLFARQLGMMPAVRKFVAPREWTKVVLPIDSFDGLDGRDILGILWTGKDSGKFSFLVDSIRLR